MRVIQIQNENTTLGQVLFSGYPLVSSKFYIEVLDKFGIEHYERNILKPFDWLSAIRLFNDDEEPICFVKSGVKLKSLPTALCTSAVSRVEPNKCGIDFWGSTDVVFLSQQHRHNLTQDYNRDIGLWTHFDVMGPQLQIFNDWQEGESYIPNEFKSIDPFIDRCCLEINGEFFYLLGKNIREDGYGAERLEVLGIGTDGYEDLLQIFRYKNKPIRVTDWHGRFVKINEIEHELVFNGTVFELI